MALRVSSISHNYVFNVFLNFLVLTVFMWCAAGALDMQLVRIPADQCGERVRLGSRVTGGFACAVTCVFPVVGLVLTQSPDCCSC